MAFLWCNQSQTFKRVAGNIVLVGIVGCLATVFLLSIISFSNYVDSKSGPQTEPLQLHVDSFSVSEFTVSESKFSAKWDANLTFENRNNGLRVMINSFRVYVHRRDWQPLACASVSDVEIEPKRKQTVALRFDTRRSCGFARPVNGDVLLSELTRDFESGSVGFSLRMKVSAFYRLRLLGLGTSVVLTPFCPDLDVGFVAGKGEGKMVSGRNCSIPLPK